MLSRSWIAFLSSSPLLLAAGCPSVREDVLSSKLDAAGPRIQATDAASALAEAASLSPGLAAWLTDSSAAPGPQVIDAWKTACPSGPAIEAASARPLMATRASTFKSCAFASLGLDADLYARASASPERGAVAASWLLQNGASKDLALKTAYALMGSPFAQGLPAELVTRLPLVETASPWPSETPVILLGTIEGAYRAAAKVTQQDLPLHRLILFEAGLGAAAPSGPFPQHAVTEATALFQGEPVLALPGDLPVGTLSRLAASSGTWASKVHLLVLRGAAGSPDEPGVLDFHLPEHGDPWVSVREWPAGFSVLAGGKPLPAVEGCAPQGPTVCREVPIARLTETLSRAQAIVPPKGQGTLYEARPRLYPMVSTRVSELAPLLIALGPEIALDLGPAPCLESPEGMTCVEGGVSQIASKPSSLSTFWIDADELSVGEALACAEAGVCRKVASWKATDPSLPVTGVSWDNARRLCGFQGKRLPTEAEWLRAAGSPGSDCESLFGKACGSPKAPRGAAAGARNATGLANTHGNVAEWVADAYSANFQGGVNPRGPCDGGPDCGGASAKRVVLGGSFKSDALREGRAGPGPDLGLRCASSWSDLAPWPPALSTAPYKSKLEALDEKRRALVRVTDEDPIEEKPPCEEIRGGSTLTCKDPIHHVQSNEAYLHAVWPYLRNRGGALIGVGSDQNYDLAAIARSEVVWFMDYDAHVVYLHRINGAFFQVAETPEAFVEMWSPANADSSLEVLRRTYAGHKDLKAMEAVMRSVRGRTYKHYKNVGLNKGKITHREGNKQTELPAPPEGWLRTPEHYQWLRQLWLQGRAWAVKGDMLGDHAMRAIGRASQELGVPIRIYYTSNAPDAWGGTLTPAYKRNVRSFFMDRDSVTLSAWGFPTLYGGPKGYWHYNIQAGRITQTLIGLSGYKVASQLVAARLPSNHSDLTLEGPSSLEQRAHVPEK